MTTSEDTLLQKIGVSCAEMKMQVLAAILKTGSASTRGALFEQIYQYLLKEARASISKPLVYRTISTLEQENYITCDRSGYRHYYKTGIEQLTRAIERRIQTVIDENSTTVAILRSELSKLEQDHVVDELLAELIDHVIHGDKRTERTKFVTGIRGTSKLVREAICKSLKSGDVVRIYLECIPKCFAAKDLATILEEILKRNSILHMLLPVDTGQYRHLDHLLGQLCNRLDLMPNRLVVRRRTQRTATYQVIIKNRESMLLVVGARPARAMYLHREAHPELVDDAVIRFDEEFTRATRIIN